MKKLRHPVRAIREPFGTAGLIVAVVALILALTGAAFAATGLNGKQKKEVEKIAKKYAGKQGAQGNPGAPGANGTAGANGTNGTPGAAGPPGANGKSVVLTTEPKGANCEQGGTKVEVEGTAASKKYVCNGLTGFTKTLPFGETETGAWGISGESTSSFIQATTGISFSIPLAQAGAGFSAFAFSKAQIDANQFGRAEDTQGKPGGKECVVGGPPVEVEPGVFKPCLDTGCKGTAAKPTAPKGTLCVYTGFEEAVNMLEPAFPSLKTPDGTENAYGVSGAFLIGGFYLPGAEAAHIESGGSWAVTAP